MGANTGNRGKGRKPGVPNKTTASAKEAITLAFEGIGGVARLAAWADEHPGEFFTKVYPKVLPREMEVSGKDGERLGVVVLPAVVSK